LRLRSCSISSSTPTFSASILSSICKGAAACPRVSSMGVLT
jgi:hypothetical protein